MNAIQHRILLSGLDERLQEFVRNALAHRGGFPSSRLSEISEAIREAKQHPTDRHLFIFQVKQPEDLTAISQLTSSFPGQPVMALLPPDSGLQTVIRAQRAGANQVVPLPWQEEDFLRALDCLALQFTPRIFNGRVLAVCGSSAGSGATSVALNLAMELAQPPGSYQKNQVIVLELTRQMGSLASYLGIEPDRSVQDLLADSSLLSPEEVERSLTRISSEVRVLVGPFREIRPGICSTRNTLQLIEIARQLADRVVLDIPCTFDEQQLDILAIAHQVVLVGVQTIASVRSLKLLRESLEREEGIFGANLVINRYEPTMPGFSAKRLGELIGVAGIQTISNDYASLTAAATEGKPLAQVAPHSRVLKDIRLLAKSLHGIKSSRTAEGTDRLTRGQGTGSPSSPRTVKLLHVEDDRFQQKLLSIQLASIKSLAVTTTVAVNEAEALAACKKETFDLVLMDYQLGQETCLPCLKHILAIKPDLPILVLSGISRPEIVSQLLEAGAEDYLGKENITGPELEKILLEVLGRKQLAAHNPREAPSPGPPSSRVISGADSDILRCIHELKTQAGGKLSAAQIQRLVDQFCSEFAKETPGQSFPRRALLGLFLRLLGNPNLEQMPAEEEPPST